VIGKEMFQYKYCGTGKREKLEIDYQRMYRKEIYLGKVSREKRKEIGP